MSFSEGLDKQLELLQDEINDDKVRVQPIVDYVCMFCGATYGDSEQALEHTKTCLRNMYDVPSCVTCKHSCYNLMPTYGKPNGYSELISKGVTSRFGYFTCEKENKHYEGKLSEEQVLKLDKGCYEPLEYGENFYVRRTAEYEEYVKLIEKANEEQEQVDLDIAEFWARVKELDEQGYSEEEIKTMLEKEYEEE